MNYKREKLINGGVYHIYNKTLFGEEIFSKNRLINCALQVLDYYRYPQKIRFSRFKKLSGGDKVHYEKAYRKAAKLVDIYAFTLMPNHYHILLKQNSDNGIKIFLSNYQNSFAKIFNLKSKRNGPLFISPFKSKRIDDDNLFLHVSRYIHLNPVTSYLLKPEELYKCNWNSFGIYMNKRPNAFIERNFLEGMYKLQRYEQFVMDQIDYQRKLRRIKHLTFE